VAAKYATQGFAKHEYLCRKYYKNKTPTITEQWCLVTIHFLVFHSSKDDHTTTLTSVASFDEDSPSFSQSLNIHSMQYGIDLN